MMYQKSLPLAVLARSISDTSPTRAKNPLRALCPWSNLHVYRPSRKQHGKSNLFSGLKYQKQNFQKVDLSVLLYWLLQWPPAKRSWIIKAFIVTFMSEKILFLYSPFGMVCVLIHRLPIEYRILTDYPSTTYWLIFDSLMAWTVID